MIYGIGTDIIEISRIANNIERHNNHFLDRLFTKPEQDYCNKYKDSATHFAGRFAAKEAIVKALGTGFGESVSWLDLEILNDATGKPFLVSSERLNGLFNHPNIIITISHCKNYATAFAIWQSAIADS